MNFSEREDDALVAKKTSPEIFSEKARQRAGKWIKPLHYPGVAAFYDIFFIRTASLYVLYLVDIK